ncbi:fluoride efflux transporter FluC [Alloscardovia criceti]|uniref:fluoride efflux transporter FluC n=1 Tax=Alloscardovia criceti TaxID=356828 RepID=UPI001FE077F4|nr:CrcB family protein [Alloscardovia criceti]
MAKHSHRISSPAPRTTMAYNPLTDVWIYVVVFVGGFFGTAVRYSLGTALNTAPYTLGIHWGTFIANMVACFIFALLAAILVAQPRKRNRSRASGRKHTRANPTSHASSRRMEQLLSRGVGMGFCGGLSTMSTLALEITANHYGWVYAVFSILSGLIFCLLGSWAGSFVVRSREDARADRSSRNSRSTDRSRQGRESDHQTRTHNVHAYPHPSSSSSSSVSYIAHRDSQLAPSTQSAHTHRAQHGEHMAHQEDASPATRPALKSSSSNSTVEYARNRSRNASRRHQKVAQQELHHQAADREDRVAQPSQGETRASRRNKRENSRRGDKARKRRH